jgi:hypothetical protein
LCSVKAAHATHTSYGSLESLVGNLLLLFLLLLLLLLLLLPATARWVVKDCVFTPNSNTPASTIRAMASYGCNKSPCFISSNTFNNPASESARLIAIAIDAAGPRGAFLTTGYNGSEWRENACDP